MSLILSHARSGTAKTMFDSLVKTRFEEVPAL